MPTTQLSRDSAGQQVEPEEQPTPASLPMYFAAIVITLCGLQAVNITLEDPGFGNLTLILTMVGFMVSFLCRQQRLPSHLVELPAALVFAVICFLTIASDQSLPFLAPADVAGDRSKGMAVFLTWLVVLRSFTLTSDSRLLFCCVPTIALIGLIGTMNSDAVLVTLFIVFVCAAVFMLVHENFLRARAATPQKQVVSAGKFLAGQIQLAALCIVGSLVVGRLAAEPMRAAGSALLFSGAMQMQNTQNQNTTDTRVVNISESTDYMVGRGPVTLGEQVVMRVEASHASNWRGATYDVYTGHGWRNSLDKSTSLAPSPDGGPGQEWFDARPHLDYPLVLVPETPINYVGAKSHAFRQVFHLEATGIFHEIYGASEIRALRLPEPAGQVDAAGGIRLAAALRATDYEVESRVADWDSESLAKSSTDYPEAIRSRYLTFGTSKPSEETIQTALRLTKDLKDPYSKMEALRDFVSTQCLYNTQSPASPSSVDVVQYFLFDRKEGYCDSFATALAVLCRAAGLPARVASGFAEGTLDSSGSTYTVRERDKHMWTEVYFTGVGWVSVDATAGAQSVDEMAEDDKKKRGGLMGFLFNHGLLPPVAALAFIAMLAYVLKVEVLDKLRRRSRPNPLGLAAANIEIVDTYARALASLRRWGMKRSDSQTPFEFQDHAAQRLASCPAAVLALQELTVLFVRFRYGGTVAEPDNVTQAHALEKALSEALRKADRRAIALAAPAGAGA